MTDVRVVEKYLRVHFEDEVANLIDEGFNPVSFEYSRSEELYRAYMVRRTIQ